MKFQLPSAKPSRQFALVTMRIYSLGKSLEENRRGDGTHIT